MTLQPSPPALSVNLPDAAKKGTRGSELIFLLQVSRPGLWSTTALFYLMPLGHVDFLHSRTVWLGLLYVLFPLGFLLYGVNDIVDADADRLNPRKGTFLFGSLGAAEQLAALRWKIAAIQIPFLVVFFVLTGPRILYWFAALLLAVVLYNAPRFGWKNHPPFDVLIQASYLLVFVLSSWLNEVSQLPWQTFVFGAMFAMHSHIFGEVMDIEPDRLSGRRTTATLISQVPSKLLIAAFLCFETGLIYHFFGDLVITGFLGMGAAWFLLDATVIWKNRSYSPTEMHLFMWGWNAAACAGMFWNWTKGSLLHARHVAGL
ncbi:MAG TPA: UbiA family prenyltransferase [Candidatus Acidoferrum sp.]|nr:UbiA family prenyltransferase [Candidatus Acidoferrum sp.]